MTKAAPAATARKGERRLQQGPFDAQRVKDWATAGEG